MKIFDRIYCINLDRRPDRWEQVSKEFIKYNIDNVIRFSGVDGANLTNTYNLLNGELGILETHLRIIDICKKDNIKDVLIMEDDVRFSNDINSIDEYINNVD